MLAAVITIGGWSLLKGASGMGAVCAIYAILYAFFAYLVSRWSRGILPLTAALSMILAIFCAVGANSWFARDKAGFDEALLPTALLGTFSESELISVADYLGSLTVYQSSQGTEIQ